MPNINVLSKRLYSLLLCIVLLFFAHFACATSYSVDTNSDIGTGSGNSGSLRYILGVINGTITGTGATAPTVGSAASSNTITVNSGLGTITLTTDLPVIQNGVTINGPIAGQTIDGNNNLYNIFATYKASSAVKKKIIISVGRFSTVPGNKGAWITRAGVRYSVLYHVSKISGWPKLVSGNNYFKTLFSAGSAQAVQIVYQRKYGGL